MNRNKQAIIDAFWELLEEKPLSKITVKDIVERCQINRNTFYYHFRDIPLLLGCFPAPASRRFCAAPAFHKKNNAPSGPLPEGTFLHKRS